MKKTVRYGGKNHKVFIVKTSFGVYPVIVVEHLYSNGGLFLEALTCREIGDGYLEPEGSFGIITVNVGVASKLYQCVKNYSENEEWAEVLAKEIGGKDTGEVCPTGYVNVPLYDFSKIKLYEDDNA